MLCFESYCQSKSLIGLEKKASLSAPDTWLTELFGAPANNSGIAITPRIAMTCAPVACAVRSISESVAQLPVHVYQRGSDGAKERAEDHPAYTLLHDAANDWTPAFEFKRQLAEDALLHHGGFAFINRVRSKRFELIRLRPETVAVRPDLLTGEPTYTVTEKENTRDIARQDILHIRAPFLNSYREESLIRLAADSIGLALLLERHATLLMANGARPSGLIALKGNLTPDALSNAKLAWQAAHGNGNSGGTAVLPADAAWQSLTFSSVDSQFMEMRKFAINDLSSHRRCATGQDRRGASLSPFPEEDGTRRG
jgi:HK97 family phage portal protein